MKDKPENKEKFNPKKTEINIDNYKEECTALVVDGQKVIEKAERIMKKISKIKSLIILESEEEEKEKEGIARKAKTDYEEKWAEYKKIKDTRVELTKAATGVYDMAKKKIKDFKDKLIRQEEERVALELKVKEEAEIKAKEKVDQEAREEEEAKAAAAKKVEDTEVVKTQRDPSNYPCRQGGTKPTDPLPQDPIETIATSTPQDKQKTDEEQNEAVKREIEVEVYDIEKVVGAVIRGEVGATWDLIQINKDLMVALAKTFKTKPGQDIIYGCRVKG